MWPFTPRKPRTPKPKSPNQLRIEELQELAPVGSSFKYMGVDCTVRSNYGCSIDIHGPGGIDYWPEVVLEYVDNLGIIREVKLDYTTFKAAMARNAE